MQLCILYVHIETSSLWAEFVNKKNRYISVRLVSKEVNICVDFDQRDVIVKILISTKLPKPIRDTRVLKLVFITIPCLKFWAQRQYTEVKNFSCIITLM